MVILNGAPRSGKSSIADEMTRAGWLNHGVDASMADTPEDLQPGIGLRPGGERADLEPEVERLYVALWDRVVALAEAGGNVVVHVGLHTDYAGDLDPWAIARRMLSDSLWLLRAYNMDWKKSKWGNATNVTAAFAADLGE